ncbi:ERB1 protein, partial [Indicator maculatus]|nr:ERB1 protein [Indicator maculatus]
GFWSAGGFCETNDTVTDQATSYETSLGAYGATFFDKTGKNINLLWNNKTAKALPPDTFLICGDRAWQGIPKNVIGGPCYLGKLTILAPTPSQLLKLARSKRSLGLTPTCDDNVQLLSQASRLALAVFVPGAASGNALRELERLACWSEKQSNVTTETLEQLLLDQNSMRHALLKNRAAIDFLLLVQGYGCEDFDGMCCMNLSSHGESIHKGIQWLKQHSDKIQQQVSTLDKWLMNLFGDIPGWLKGLLIEGLKILVLVLIILLCSCVVYS